MMHLQPPAGIPITIGQLVKITGRRLLAGKCPDRFIADIGRDMKIGHGYLVNSGRTALAVGLQALAATSKRTEVIIPAYTCFTVAASIARSGLKIRLADIDPSTLDYNYDKIRQIDFTSVLAIIGCNMFGLICDWPRLQQIAREQKVFLIDDAAQSMGGSMAGQASGTFGDIGFFSLGRGKNMTAYSGGVLITNDDNLAMKIEKIIAGLDQPGRMAELKIAIKLALYGLFLRPWLYWLPASLPFLGLGETEFEPEFEMTSLGKIQACAAAVIYERLADLRKIRDRHAQKIASLLAGRGNHCISGLVLGELPDYLRLPVLMKNRSERDQAILKLRKNNIVASSMYPSTIAQIPGIDKYLACDKEDYPGAQQVVDRLVALPIHPYMTDSDIKRIASCFGEGR